jgi:hypothetical protein
VLQGVFQSRVIVLTLLAVVAVGAVSFCALSGHMLSLRATLVLMAVGAVALVFSILHLRHAGLALSAAFAPLPGLVGAASLGLPVEPMALAFLAGSTVALFLADEIALRVLDGSGVVAATAETLRENAIAGCVAATAAAAFTAVLLFAGHHARLPLVTALAELGSGLSALIVLPLAASQLLFSEDFVARANRLRELRERRLERIAAVTEPRWGWSLTGIGVVFFALAYFGSRSLHASPSAAHSALEIWLVAAIVVTGAALATTRDWRRSLAVVTVLGLAALVGCWGYARAGILLNVTSWLALMQVLGTGAAMTLLVANAAQPEADEDGAAAMVRSLLGKTGAAVTSSACGIVVLLALSLSVGREAMALAAALFFAGLGAVLLQPALTIAIETIAPRRSTIAARYRVS